MAHEAMNEEAINKVAEISGQQKAKYESLLSHLGDAQLAVESLINTTTQIVESLGSSHDVANAILEDIATARARGEDHTYIDTNNLQGLDSFRESYVDDVARLAQGFAELSQANQAINASMQQ